MFGTLRAWVRYDTLQKLLPEFSIMGKKKTTALLEAAGKFIMLYNTLRVLKVKEVEWRGKKYRIS